MSIHACASCAQCEQCAICGCGHWMTAAKQVWDATAAPDVTLTQEQYFAKDSQWGGTVSRGATVTVLDPAGNSSMVISTCWNPEQAVDDCIENMHEALAFFEQWAEGDREVNGVHVRWRDEAMIRMRDGLRMALGKA